MDIDKLSEADITTKLVIPSIIKSGWNSNTQIREQFTITKGRVNVFGNKTKRETPLRPDIVLFNNETDFIPLVTIEIKKSTATADEGIQKSILYSEKLNVPFAFSTNGKEFLFHDKTNSNKETFIKMDSFPTYDYLWQKYLKWKNISNENIYKDYFYQDRNTKEPRYYQSIAINKTIREIEKGKKRGLIVMATGTGKTFVAFQIVHKLIKSKKINRVLFLADRNILVDQTMLNDFSPLSKIMTKIKNRKIDKSYKVYMALYQAVTGIEDFNNIYKDLDKNFFDLIIIDECHRGSARDNSNWRKILEHFNSSIQIGMTATPKETKDISNITYFGEPIYTYSLKSGIEDGFLAPYKIIKFNIDKDKGWAPQEGMKDDEGKIIENREYNSKDYDKSLILENRNEIIANSVSKYLKDTDIMSKTIVFCEDKKHASRMRQKFIKYNEEEYKKNSKYVVRIVSGDEVGENEIDNFKDPNSKYPVIATTSRLLSTGVDTQTVKNIVLDKNIASITEFKQIIGRGTRIQEEYNKFYFTIFDFRNATKIFFDPDFDGEPIVKYEIDTKEKFNKNEYIDNDEKKDNEENQNNTKSIKYYLGGLKVKIESNRTLYLDEDNNLITNNIFEYTKNRVLSIFKNYEDFKNKWISSDFKKDISKMLLDNKIYIDVLSEEKENKLDTFDLICHIVYDKKVLTKSERISKAKPKLIKNNLENKKYETIIEYIFNKYAEEGIEEIEDINIFKLKPFSNEGTPFEIINDIFGGIEKYENVMKTIKSELYND
jgi:type I restriction enzyme, R subunit